MPNNNFICTASSSYLGLWVFKRACAAEPVLKIVAARTPLDMESIAILPIQILDVGSALSVGENQFPAARTLLLPREQRKKPLLPQPREFASPTLTFGRDGRSHLLA